MNGTRCSPAMRMVASRAAGSLSGEPKCGPPRSTSRADVAFQHHALRDRHLAQCCQIGLVEQARIDVRQQAGLIENQTGGLGEIRQRAGMA